MSVMLSYDLIVGPEYKRSRNESGQGEALGPEKQWARANRRATEVNPREAGGEEKQRTYRQRRQRGSAAASPLMAQWGERGGRGERH